MDSEGVWGWDRIAVRILGWMGLWTAIGLFFSTQTYLNVMGGDRAWSVALSANLPRWLIWGALTPLVMRSDGWAKGRGEGLSGRVGWHVPLGVWWCSLHNLFKKTADQVLGLSPTWSLADFATMYHWNLLIYAVIVGAIIAFDYHVAAREHALRASRLEARLAESRLKVLKAQLHPHFLFNTLHAISAFMEHDPKVARRMTAHLGDMLRYTLDHGDEQEMALADDVTVIEHYLAIQQIRFQDRLHVAMDIAPETLGVPVPSLILQPLVENAVEHGLAHRTADGRIRVSARRRDHSLLLTVSDDGEGLPPGWSINGGGVGLRNTMERLAQLYGRQASLDVRNGDEGGVTATITLPWRTNGQD